MRARFTGANRPLLALITEGFLSRLSFGFVTFGLPLYAYQLGLGLAEIGLLVSLDVSVALAARPVAGHVADRCGLKKTFAAAIGLRSLVALCFALAGSPWQLFLLRSTMGLAQALRDPPLTALIAEHGGKKTLATAFAWYQTAKAVAGPLGAGLAGALLTLTDANFSFVFGVAFLLSLLPFYVIMRYVQEKRSVAAPDAHRMLDEAVPETASTTSGNDGQARPPRSAIPAFVGLGFLISGTAQMLRGFLPILATEYAGLNEAAAGIVFLTSSCIVLFTGPLFGWLSDHVSRRLVLSVRGIANTLSSIVFLAAPSLAGFVLGKTLDDVGKSAFRLAWGTLMAEVSELDPRSRGQTISLMSMGEDGGEIAGPLLAGLLWSTWGITALRGARVVLAVGTEIYASVLTWSLERRRVAGGLGTVRPSPLSTR
jgi:MFS family permease